ncbi:zinc finger protein 436-like [Anthonomus grandis grandis]|uniref:zinc finger protein 436-like n=1 Tax=Anthonomus grandis grandis TaxID=2921223 RepID=UPI0021653D75|nr:zinc finger protein 436-like [Anthonomus grandis grandis]
MSKTATTERSFKGLNDTTEDLTPLCRTCLRKKDDMKFLPLNLEQMNSILQRLMFLLNVEITLAEKTPMYLCSTCEEYINISYNFKEQCIQSNDYIQNWVSLKDSDLLPFEDEVKDHIVDKSDLIEQQCSSCNTTFKTFKDVHLNHSASLCHLCKFQTLGTGLDSRQIEMSNECDDDPLNLDCQDSKDDLGVKYQQRLRLKQYSPEEIRNIVDAVKKKYYKHVTCKICKFTGAENRNLSVHIGRVHSEIKHMWCSICNETFPDLNQHHEEVHSDDLKCPLCGKNRRNMGKFVEHMSYHTASRFFQCSICGSSYNFLRQLKRHQLLHHRVQRAPEKTVKKSVTEPEKCSVKVKYLCPHCGKQFTANHKLVVHIRSHTGEAPYQCGFCDKRFKVRAHYLMHERTHTGEKPHKCTFCDKSFAQSSTLKTHLIIHTGKKIECTICRKTFCRAAQLRLHMREHTGEKPYKCETCSQTFKQKSHLVEHSKRHSDDRPFECSFCGKSFKNQYTMKVHEQIHTGDKPFQCSQCTYACRQAYSLTQHMKQHENDKPQGHNPHVCHVCQKSYVTLAHLFTHMRRYHPNIILTNQTEEPLPSDPDDPPEEEEEEENPYIPMEIKVLENNDFIPEESGTTSNQVEESPMLEFTVLD